MKPSNNSKSFLLVSLAFLLGLIVMDISTTNAEAANPVSVPKNIKFEETVSGLVDPLFVANAGDGSGRLFIVQRNGQIRIFKNGSLNSTPFLNVSGLITTAGGEQGLLGLAFDPNYTSSGRFYIAYTAASSGAVKLARYSVSTGDPDLADPAETVLLTISEPYPNHNGGMIAFGPDGYLYMAVGDGGGGGDPNNNGQNKNTLLGKILRLDVSGLTYSIPATNPFYGRSNVKEEIWAYGLRNPWRFSFDKTTGDLYIGDVGQNKQEEINFQSSTSLGGENYGWRILEGNLCYMPANCTPPASYIPPVIIYDHGTDDSIGCSVTGGYVYRGSQFPALNGVYLYGDFCRGKVWGMFKNGSGQWISNLIFDTDYLISSFGEGEDGEIYLADYGAGKIYHIVEAPILQDTFLSDAVFDGTIRESSENSGQGGSKNPTGTILKLGDDSANRQFRSILSFDTEGLPDNAAVTNMQLKINVQGFVGDNMFTPTKTHGNLVVDIRKQYFGADVNLAVTDFQSGASRNAVGVLSNIPSTGWRTVTLKSKAYPFINLTGTTQFRLRFQTDDNNDNGADYLKIFSGNAGTASRPQLIVEYYIP